MVKLISAKCPNCGANLSLSKDDEKVQCDYCHNEITVDDAIACYKLKISGTVSVDGITSNSELIKAANELLDMDEFLKAKRKFLEFSEKCPNDYQGWLGLLICRTRNFTIKDNNIMFENDVNDYYSHFKNTASKEVFDKYYETIDRYLDHEKYKEIDRQEELNQYYQNLEEKKKEKEKRRAEKMANSKAYRNITETANKGKNVLLKILNGFLYLVGFALIYSPLVQKTPTLEKVFMIILGISLFKIIYDFIEQKLHLPKKQILIIRIVIPFILLILAASFYTPSKEKDKDNTQNNNEQVETENVNN